MPVTCIPVLILLGTGLVVNPAKAKSPADLRSQATASHPGVRTIDTPIDRSPDFGTAVSDLLKAKLLRPKADAPGSGRGASQWGRQA